MTTTSFRYKPDKIKYLTNIDTLDTLHKKHVGTFNDRKNNLQNLKQELEKCQNKMNSIDLSKTENWITIMKTKSDLKTKIENLKSEINDIENDVSELEYYSITSEILVDYYSINNDKNNCEEIYVPDSQLVSSQIANKPENDSYSKLRDLQVKSQEKRKPQKITRRRIRKDEKLQQYCILDFFASDDESNKKNNVCGDKNSKNNDDDKNCDKNNDENDNKMPAENKTGNVKIVSNKASLFNEYMRYVNHTTTSIDKKDKLKLCSTCGIEKKIMQSEGICVCTKCGEAEPIIIESEMLSHKDTVIEKVHYPYKRINHFMEWLNQFQAKESTDIPEQVYVDIRAELKKQKITNVNQISTKRVRIILKKLKYSEHYEHTIYIVCRLTGKTPPTLSRETEEKIKTMFKQIQEPFMRHCPPSRINFLSYSYVLHKIFKIIKLEKYTAFFELLKSKEKLRSQEEMWKKICDDLKWPFYSSVDI
jgi:hypothetical protein